MSTSSTEDAGALVAHYKSAQHSLGVALAALHSASKSFSALRNCAEDLGSRSKRRKLSTVVNNSDAELEKLAKNLKEVEGRYEAHRLKMENEIVRLSVANGLSLSHSQSQPSVEDGS